MTSPAKVHTLPTLRNAGAVASTPKRPRWGSGKEDPIAAGVAKRLGIATKTAEHLLRELPGKVVAVLEEFEAQGADLRRGRFTRRIIAALEHREAPPLCPATWQLAQDADTREDSAETAYHTDPSDANLNRLIRATEAEIQKQDAKLLALCAERDRRRRERV